MDIDLLFGRNGLTVDLPPEARVDLIEKPAVPVPDDPHAVIAGALANPMGAATLDELSRGRQSACILICDVTRPVPNHLFLRPMIETMVREGIPLDRITVLVATGLHRPNLGEELAQIVGDPWVLENVRVENHYAERDEDHVDLGTTEKRGVPIKLDRRLVEADLRIATGLVEPHFMAGYSGGRKVVAPGVAHHETIRMFHSARFMEDEFARVSNLDGNPLHEEQLQIVRTLGEIYALNTVIDDKRNLVFASFGEIIVSHLAAVAFVRTFTELDIPRKYSTVLTSCAGFPLDLTYYQVVKAMATPMSILKPGGTLIVAAECAEGLGSASFIACQKRMIEMGPDAYLESLLGKRLADIDEWSTEWQLKPRRMARVLLHAPGLSPEDAALTGVEMIDDVAGAVAYSIVESGDPHVAVIPEGPYVVPLYKPSLAAE